MSKFLLSIDASTKKTGYSIFNMEDKSLIEAGVIEQTDDKLQGREPRNKRILHMACEINEVFKKYNISKVVQEDVPPAINNSDTVLALGIVKGAIMFVAYTYDLEIEYIPVSTWHSALNILKSKGNLKQQSVEWVNQKYGTQYIYKSPSSKFNDDDITDSICIASYYLGNYDKPKVIGRKSKINNK